MNQDERTKKCSKCQSIKPINEFYISKQNVLYSRCKICEKNKGIINRQNNPEKIKNQERKSYVKNKAKIKIRAKLYRLKNKEKIKQQKHLDYLKVKSNSEKYERVKQIKRDWYVANLQKIRERNTAYRLSRLDYSRKYAREYIKNRKLTDLNFKLTVSTRDRTVQAFKNYKKSKTTQELVGISNIEYRQYIENLFYTSPLHGDMTWDKHGSGPNLWQIHHICPIEYIDMLNSIEVKQTFHYTNTKPLWHEDHVKEHKKINERMKCYI